MAKMTIDQALRGGKYVLRKKKEQAGLKKDQQKPMRKLVDDGHTLAKADRLTKKGDKYQDNTGHNDETSKAKTYKYA